MSTWVYDLLFFTEGNSRAPPLPLGSLDFQVSLLNGECRDAFVMSRVELCQVLEETRHYAYETLERNSVIFTYILHRMLDRGFNFTHLELGLLLRQSQQPLQFLVLHPFTVSCAGAALRLWFLSQRVDACGRSERHGRVDRHLLRFVRLEPDSAQKCAMG